MAGEPAAQRSDVEGNAVTEVLSAPQTHSRDQAGPVFALVLMAALWGSSYSLIKFVLVEVSPTDFLGVRFALSALIMVLLFFKHVRRASRQLWFHGLLLGGIHGLAQIAQTWGLGHCDASVSGFITAMYVVFTPLVLWGITRHKIAASTWIAVVIAMVGLGLLSLNGFSIGIGEAVTLLSAFIFAVHLVLLGLWASRYDTLSLATIQMVGVGLCCLLAALPGGVQVPKSGFVWALFAHLVLFVGVGTFLLQTWAQRRIQADRAAILMTTEPVFAAVFAVAFLSEAVTIRLVIGGLCILVATIIAERK